MSAIYKDRWEVELSFKALKQNLKIKTCRGARANAVKIQIWMALIAMLILRYLQLKSKYHWSLFNLGSLLRMTLLTHTNLWAWRDSPFETLPLQYNPDQMTLNYAYFGQHKWEPEVKNIKNLSQAAYIIMTGFF